MNEMNLLINFAKELEFGKDFTLEQKLQLMTDLVNAIYTTKQQESN